MWLARCSRLRSKSAGLEPSRLLVEEFGDAETKRRMELQKHVAANVYFITMSEWALTREVVKKKTKERKRQDHAALQQGFKDFFSRLQQTAALVLISLVSILIFGGTHIRRNFVIFVLRKNIPKPPVEGAERAPGPPAVAVAEKNEKQTMSFTKLEAAKRLVSRMRSAVVRTSNSLSEVALQNGDVEEGNKRTSTEDGDEIPRGERLDEEHLAQNEGEEVAEVIDDTNAGGTIK